MEKEQKLIEKNKDDIFTCQSCGKKMTRGEIRKIWDVIPFCKEDSKTYYCGCNGWD